MVLCPDLNSLTRLGARTVFYSAIAPTQSKTINKLLTEGLTDCRNLRSLEILGSLHCTTPENTIQIVFHGCASLNLVVKFRLDFFFLTDRSLNSLLEQNYTFPYPLTGSNYMNKFSQLP